MTTIGKPEEEFEVIPQPMIIPEPEPVPAGTPS